MSSAKQRRPAHCCPNSRSASGKKPFEISVNVYSVRPVGKTSKRAEVVAPVPAPTSITRSGRPFGNPATAARTPSATMRFTARTGGELRYRLAAPSSPPKSSSSASARPRSTSASDFPHRRSTTSSIESALASVAPSSGIAVEVGAAATCQPPAGSRLRIPISSSTDSNRWNSRP